MADEKRLPPIELVAVERGFVNGRMVEPGRTFLFDPNPVSTDGEKRRVGPDGLRRIPKWAAKPDDAGKRMKAKPVGGDIRPKDAQAASKVKAGELAGGSVPA